MWMAVPTTAPMMQLLRSSRMTRQRPRRLRKLRTGPRRRWLAGLPKIRAREQRRLWRVLRPRATRTVRGIAHRSSAIRIALRIALSRPARHAARSQTILSARSIVRSPNAPCSARRSPATKMPTSSAPLRSALRSARGRRVRWTARIMCHARMFATLQSALGTVGAPRLARSRSATWSARRPQDAPRTMICRLWRPRTLWRMTSEPPEPRG
mmetsp:Transcript_53288/g.116994  ORF Transcript_53288/g.116994 Transcript_53288/m.116994 type:complete len:211 (+) Transcript_53288:306-938(+)